MSDTDRLRSLPAIGATFVVLGLIGWAWFDLREFGQGALTGRRPHRAGRSRRHGSTGPAS